MAYGHILRGISPIELQIWGGSFWKYRGKLLKLWGESFENMGDPFENMGEIFWKYGGIFGKKGEYPLHRSSTEVVIYKALLHYGADHSQVPVMVDDDAWEPI